jgi:hypothetical protein
MKYRKEDLPKIIVLAVILLGVLIWIGISYFREVRKLHAKMAAADQAIHAAERAQLKPGAQETGLASTLANVIAQVPPPTRDPFDPIIPPRNLVAASTARQSLQPPKRETMAVLPTLPPLPNSEASGAAGDREALQLTGIIMGPPTIVVMRRGNDHYILHPGDLLEGRLRVESVGRNAVTLRDRQGSYTLRLGG